jgi:CheY-like chemotaxis protein
LADEKAVYRVLLVDDDDEVLALVPMILRDGGFEVDVASGGAEALFAVGEDAPDAVVLDYRFPDGTGDTVAATIRRLLPDVRIVGFSAVARDGQGWADAFVRKEDMSQLVPTLKRILSPQS